MFKAITLEMSLKPFKRTDEEYIRSVAVGAYLFDRYATLTREEKRNIKELAAYIRKCAPASKLILQQTWAYEEGSARLTNELKFEKSADMLAKIVESYNKAADEMGADGIIRSGEMMYKLSNSGIDKVHRDTFHASLGAGRYALALLWLRTLCKVSVTGNSFADFDAPVTDEEKKIVWEVVDSFEV